MYSFRLFIGIEFDEGWVLCRVVNEIVDYLFMCNSNCTNQCNDLNIDSINKYLLF